LRVERERENGERGKQVDGLQVAAALLRLMENKLGTTISPPSRAEEDGEGGELEK
jgi:hypothetical protein